MKKLLILAAALVLAAACNSGSRYTVKGTITGDSEALINGKAYLFNQDRENPIRDTAVVVDGVFKFTGSVITPEPYVISIEGLPGMVSIFLENEDFTVTGVDTAFAESVVTGGQAQTKLNRYADSAEELAERYGLNDVIEVLGSAEVTEIEREEAMRTYEQYQNAVEDLKRSLVADAPVSNLALYLLSQDYIYLDVDTLSSMLDAYKADPAFAENKYVAELDEYLQKELSLSIGNKAPDFTLNNPDGEPVTFSEFYKGNKVTMLDFRDKDSWIEGIKEDGLTWTQVSDLKFWQSEVGQLYNVSFIPQNVFVDAEGNIIGRKVAEGDIETLLDEYLK